MQYIIVECDDDDDDEEILKVAEERETNERDRLLTAAQDQALLTNSVKKVKLTVLLSYFNPRHIKLVVLKRGHTGMIAAISFSY